MFLKGNGGSDPDSGRMPPPQPPINLGKPPRSDKFNFIPVLGTLQFPRMLIAEVGIGSKKDWQYMYLILYCIDRVYLGLGTGMQYSFFHLCHFHVLQGMISMQKKE